MKKAGFNLIFALMMLILCVEFVSALGINPAVWDFNYVPNQRETFQVNVFSGVPGRKVSIFAEGELAPYVKVSPDSFATDGGLVNVTLTMPPSMSTPGVNTVYVTAQEEPSQNVFVGTAVAVRATIKIHVPYPGKYIEPTLSVPDANIGEKVPVEVKVINRGTDELTVDTDINFYDSSRKLVQTMTFEPINLKTGELDYFRRYLETTNFKADNYFAEAVIDYSGEKYLLNKTFKVGTLSLSITNFTKSLVADKVNKFAIGVKSNWNGHLDSVYADINIMNESFRTSFRTPQMTLDAWEEKSLETYFDTTGIGAGEYNAEITLNYEGQTTFASGKITIVKEKSQISPWIWVIGGIVVGLIAIGAIIYILVKRFVKIEIKKKR